MQYLIGVDGGGTKTAICAASVDNSKLLYAKTTGISWREHGAHAITQIIKEKLHETIGEDFIKIGGIAIGLPCYGESAGGDRALKQAISETFPGIPVYFANDVEVGWAGSLALEPGIHLVAGTGSIAFGKDIHGNTARSGGWSEFYGDEGSCYWVGRGVMQLFSKQSDGRCPKDELYEEVCREFGLRNDMEFIDVIYNEYTDNRKSVASLQLLAEKAARAGSQSAKSLYSEAVRELCLHVNAIREKLDFGKGGLTVSYSGGLFKAGDLVLPQLKDEIEKNGGRLTVPKFSPVQGAVLLAFQHFYPEGVKIIERNLKQYE